MRSSFLSFLFLSGYFQRDIPNKHADQFSLALRILVLFSRLYLETKFIRYVCRDIVKVTDIRLRRLRWNINYSNAAHLITPWERFFLHIILDLIAISISFELSS